MVSVCELAKDIAHYLHTKRCFAENLCLNQFKIASLVNRTHVSIKLSGDGLVGATKVVSRVFSTKVSFAYLTKAEVVRLRSICGKVVRVVLVMSPRSPKFSNLRRSVARPSTKCAAEGAASWAWTQRRRYPCHSVTTAARATCAAGQVAKSCRRDDLWRTTCQSTDTGARYEKNQATIFEV